VGHGPTSPPQWRGGTRNIGEVEWCTTLVYSRELSTPQRGLNLKFSKATIQDAQITVALMTLLAIVGQTILLLPIAWSMAWSLLQSGLSNYVPITWADKPILITFGLVTPLYCIVTTSLFMVKRRLSPLYIHTGTFVLFAFIMMDATLRASIGPTSASWLSHVPTLVIRTFTPFLVTLVLLGIVQTYVVYQVVGLNPPDEPLDQKTYSIQADEDSVIYVIEHSYIDGLATLGSEIYEIRKRGAKFLALAVSSASKNRTLLSTVPYEFTASSMTRTRATSEIRNSLVNDLEKRLSEYKNKNVRFSAVTTLDDAASRQALDVALKRTRSRLSALESSWREVPRSHKLVAAILVAILLMTVALYLAHLIMDLGTIWSIIVLDALGLLLEFGLPLREELSRRKKEVKLFSS
jgi:hypothetical protein